MNNMKSTGAVVNAEIYECLLSERPEESHKELSSTEMSSSAAGRAGRAS